MGLAPRPLRGALRRRARRAPLHGESTPFYLYDREAQRRIRAVSPDARLIAVLRDPVDRAYSNWMHLWSDGLEPIGDFLAACAAEDERVAAGWAPFWHYRGLGRYGEQLEHLYSLFPREQVLVLRYRELVDYPAETLDGSATFLGVATGLLMPPGPENVRPFVPDTPAHACCSAGRAGRRRRSAPSPRRRCGAARAPAAGGAARGRRPGRR